MAVTPLVSSHLPAPPRTPWQIVAGRFLRNKAALFGGAVLFVLYFCALFAGFVAPYDPYRATSSKPDHPPHRIHFFDEQGRFHIRPFVYPYELTDVRRRKYVRDTRKPLPITLFVKGDPYKLWWIFNCERHLIGLKDQGTAGERLHVFGTDSLGRDIFSRVLYGSQISLSVGLIGILITMSLGLLIGGVSGYFGGWIDTGLMRLIELMMSIPGLYLILAMRAALMGDSPVALWLFQLEPGEKPTAGQVYVMIIAILGLVGWGGTARVIRGIVLSVKQLDYVQAARALGSSHLAIIIRHVLPNTITYVIVAATLAVPGYILGEVSLSFLGVGIEEPTPSWGLMLRDAQTINTLKNAPWVLVPGVFIFITVFAYNFLGDGLRDALDPKAVE